MADDVLVSRIEAALSSEHWDDYDKAQARQLAVRLADVLRPHVVLREELEATRAALRALTAPFFLFGDNWHWDVRPSQDLDDALATARARLGDSDV